MQRLQMIIALTNKSTENLGFTLKIVEDNAHAETL